MDAPGISNTPSRRLDWLDALRGWAVLGVVMVHSGMAAHNTGLTEHIASAGQYGVQLFFIVSAMTISLTYDSHIARFGHGLRSQFAWFIKRFFRIAPLYYIAAFFYPVEQYVTYKASQHRVGHLTTIPDILANLLFVHTWIPSANNSVVPGGWSIGVEMFFYLLVPLIWLLTAISPRARAVVLGLASIAFLGITQLTCHAVTGSWYAPDNKYFYYWFPTQAPVILIGLILYFLHGTRLRNPQEQQPTLPCLFGFLLCVPVALYCGTWGKWMPILAPSILAIGFVLLILSMDGWVKSLLVSRWAVTLGKISFSVYILHFVVLDALRVFLQAIHFQHYNFAMLPIFTLFIALATSGIAFLTKRWIEDPMIAYGHRLSLVVAGAAKMEKAVAK